VDHRFVNEIVRVDWHVRCTKPAVMLSSLRPVVLLLLVCGCGSAGSDAVGTSSEALTVATGVDYSWARPSPSGLKADGYTFACRYLSNDTTGKNLSASEASALWAAGVDVVANWEDSATAALDGHAQGVSDATTADSQASSDGGPSTRPIYFSIDFDAESSDMASIEAYFEGVASVIGLSRTGAYGGYAAINDLFNSGKITFGWQTYAWSSGQWDSRAQLRQVQNGITAAGSADCCDEDQAVAADYGQWHFATPYAAQFVSQSFPYATTTMTMTAGQVIPSFIELKNVGSATWDGSTRIGTTEPRDRTSAFASSTWVAPNRPSQVTGSVAPGQSYKFTFDLEAPEKPGLYDEHFGVVQDGVAWFSDPGQGGPADSQLEVKIQVVASDAGVPDSGAHTGDVRTSGGALVHAVDVNVASGAGCDVGSRPDKGSLVSILMVFAALGRRRRAAIATAIKQR
jgi:hypothetical protein